MITVFILFLNIFPSSYPKLTLLPVAPARIRIHSPQHQKPRIGSRENKILGKT